MDRIIQIINKCPPIKKILQKGYRTLKWHFIPTIKLCRLKISLPKKKKNITVVFLSQMPALWNKSCLVYEKFKADNRFDVYILAIPGDLNDLNKNESYDYHINYGNDKVINAYTNQSFFDLKNLQTDYVFYERPYGNLLPVCYQSKSIIRFAKTCYIPYGYDPLPSLSEIIHLNGDFISNIYFYFPATYFSFENRIKWYHITHMLKLRKTEWCSYPSLEDVLNRKEQKINLFHNEKATVMWTPRWATDEKVIKSNFFIYYQDVLNYALESESFNFLFRPHPMALDNFLNKGLLTKRELNRILDVFEDNKRMILDKEPDYIKSLLAADILLTDYSSIIAEYFLLDKPIIYCKAENEVEYSEEFQAILDSCYLVNNFSDIKKHLEQLLNGNDYLKEQREFVKQKYFKDEFIKNCSNTIKEKIIEDYLN